MLAGLPRLSGCSYSATARRVIVNEPTPTSRAKKLGTFLDTETSSWVGRLGVRAAAQDMVWPGQAFTTTPPEPSTYPFWALTALAVEPAVAGSPGRLTTPEREAASAAFCSFRPWKNQFPTSTAKPQRPRKVVRPRASQTTTAPASRRPRWGRVALSLAAGIARDGLEPGDRVVGQRGRRPEDPGDHPVLDLHEDPQGVGRVGGAGVLGAGSGRRPAVAPGGQGPRTGGRLPGIDPAGGAVDAETVLGAPGPVVDGEPGGVGLVDPELLDPRGRHVGQRGACGSSRVVGVLMGVGGVLASLDRRQPGGGPGHRREVEGVLEQQTELGQAEAHHQQHGEHQSGLHDEGAPVGRRPAGPEHLPHRTEPVSGLAAGKGRIIVVVSVPSPARKMPRRSHSPVAHSRRVTDRGGWYGFTRMWEADGPAGTGHLPVGLSKFGRQGM